MACWQLLFMLSGAVTIGLVLVAPLCVSFSFLLKFSACTCSARTASIDGFIALIDSFPAVGAISNRPDDFVGHAS